MAIDVDLKYRIKRPGGKTEARMKYLIHELKIFQSYSQILVVSAVIGYNNNVYAQIEEQGSDTVLMQFFTHKNYNVMNFLAYARVKEQRILTQKDENNKYEKYEIFESYANAGFDILWTKLGIDEINKEKNDRLTILRRYFDLLISDDLYL